MKKITLLTFLVVFYTTLTFAQTYDFEDSDVSSFPTTTNFTTIAEANPSATSPNTSAISMKVTTIDATNSSAGLVYDNPEGNDYSSSTGTLTFDVYFPSSPALSSNELDIYLWSNTGENTGTNHRLEFSTGTFTSNTWHSVTLTIASGAVVGTPGSTWNKVSIFPNRGTHEAAGVSYYLDNIVFPEIPPVDEDGDHYYTAVSSEPDYLGVDCDDSNAAINPGATEINGTIDDENCDGNVNDGETGFSTLPLNFDSDTDQLALENLSTEARFETSEDGNVGTFTTNTSVLTSNKNYTFIYTLDSPIDVSIDKTGTVDLLIDILANTDLAVNSHSIDITFFDDDASTNVVLKTVLPYDNSADGVTPGTFTSVAFDLTGETDINGDPVASFNQVDRIGFSFNKSVSSNTVTGDLFKIDNLDLNGTPLSVDSVSKSDFEFNFFPNPIQDKVSLRASKQIEVVKIKNTLGQIVLNKEIYGLEGQADVSSLNSGIYILEVVIDGVSLTSKVIKK